ncbi:MAG: DUF4331 domain-containing protein, partial [Betaproteobacteria bacterium]|nr:DUF4331 domain-containing protein [Betaproteobacteria bacterium]
LGQPRKPRSRPVQPAFVDTYIRSLSNGGRVIAGQFDDPYQLDEKGIFDLVNLNTDDLGGIPGARRAPGKDVFTGFNIFSIAIEIPMTDVFPGGIPHNGVLDVNSTDSLLRVFTTINKQRVQSVDPTNIITGYKGSGDWVQVGHQPDVGRHQFRRRHPLPGAGARRRCPGHLPRPGRAAGHGRHGAEGPAL